jgi:hypothetical protein
MHIELPPYECVYSKSTLAVLVPGSLAQTNKKNFTMPGITEKI